MVVGILVLSSSLVAAQCPPATEGQVRHEFEEWVKAYDSHDLAKTMAIFASDVRFEFQGSAEKGWKELEQGYIRSFARPGQSTWVPAWDQILVSGNLATAFSTWRGIVTPPGGKPEVREENRGVDVLQRQTDCRWRIVHSLTFPMKTAPSTAK